MKYDFSTIVHRDKQGSAKWNGMKKLNPNVSEHVAPFSVADTDLLSAPEIVEGLKQFLNVAPLGYTMPTDSYYESLISWMKRRHNTIVEKDWIVLSPGVVTALYNCVKIYTKPKDSVLIMSPVYYPFRMSIENNDRNVVESSLIRKETTYEIDFEDFEEKAKREDVTMFILCNPHNPVGAVWTREDLTRISEICNKYGVLVVSDEIHMDLIMSSYTHQVYSDISEDAKQNCVVCTAPSKTFNLAGLQTSNLIIPNEKLRVQYVEYVSKNGFHTLNILGMKACEIAYNEAEAWLDEFLILIENNHKALKEFFALYIPMVDVIELQGTYLQWLDFNKLGMKPKELEEFLTMECELFFDEGYIFGKEGRGYERINIACPTGLLMEGLERLKLNLEKKGIIKGEYNEQ